MKRCFEFINTPLEFEINYYLEDNEIIVTSNNSQNKQKITKSRIRYYEALLEKQYKRIIDSQEEILQTKIDIKTVIYCSLAMLLCILSSVSSEFSEILGMSLCGTSIATLIINAIDNTIYSYIFKSKIKTYESFLNERKELEQYADVNKKITSLLSNKALTILNQNQELKKQNLIDDIFSINFMDKASLKELKQILYFYSINNSDKSYIINDNPSLNLTAKIDRIKKRIRSK